MSLLGRLPRWARWALLGLDLAASLIVLIHWWAASYPNLIAAWFQFAAVAALAAPAGAWLGRWLDARHAGHHEDTRAHITQQLAPLQRSLDDLHAKLDRQQGSTP